MKIGASIRKKRRAKGITQAKLAALTDIGASYISRIEAGGHQPSVATIERIAKALGTTTLKILEDA